MNMVQAGFENVSLSEKGLYIVLPNGKRAYFNYYWLRDNCPSSFNASTRERSFDIFHLAQAPLADSASLEGGTLIIS
jgi:gamma-butyrobetaine dioxygenase